MVPRISREEALEMIKDSSKYDHLLRVSKSMILLAEHFKQDAAEWELVGLLHDYDFDLTRDNRSIHGVLAAETLDGKLSEESLLAIKSHDFRTGYEPESLLAKVLISVDAFDTFLKLVKEEETDFSTNSLKNRIKKWEMPKPWLKQLIEQVEELDISLDLFIEYNLKSHFD